MKILLINTFLYRRGGDCTYMFSLGELLKSKGHEVFYWGMKHPQNIIHEYEEYFPQYIDYVEMNANKNPINALKVLTRSIYSIEAKKKLRLFLNIIKPDIIHLNNIHAHLTPSIIDEIIKHNIGLVWTLHDCKLLCPNSIFLSNKGYCEKCLGSKFYQCILNKCKKNSFMASVVATIEAYIHLFFLNIPQKVDYFIVSSKELYKKLIESGYSRNKLCKIKYFKNFKNKLSVVKKRSYCMFIGNLHYGKGVKTLLRAAIGYPEIKFKIVGDGILFRDIELEININKIKNVKLLGYVKDVGKIFNDCNFVIVPSECFENFPYVIIEANLHGKPVIGSNIGGIPEMITNYENGILFKSGDYLDLGEKIKYLFERPKLSAKMGKKAYNLTLKEYNSEIHYQNIIKIYNKAINNHKKNCL